jgi:hypothetical protein
MTFRLLRRCIAAFTALATLVAPVAWPLVALASAGGRTLPVSVCTTAGAPVLAGIAIPAPAPMDRGGAHDCQKCVLCAGSSDRPLAGPLPGRISVPHCAARAEAPVAPPVLAPAAAPARLSRARGPPPLA